MLTCRTDVDVLFGVKDERAAIEPPARPCIRRRYLWQRDRDVVVFAGNDFLAFVVTFVGNNIELVDAECITCLVGHVRQGIAVRSDIGDLVCNDQMVLGINRTLHIVANDTGMPAGDCH